jgi:inosine-uridine nucleoside N-ribohydrolase
VTLPRKVVIDTDPGIDDAIAIFLALASPEVELLGLTTVFGNAAIGVTTRNALSLLEIAGRPDIPVAAGAATPLVAPYNGPAPEIHGADGQGNAALPEPQGRPLPLPAAEVLWQTAARHPRLVTVLAIGPLTNLALALRLHPEIAGLVERVVVMGGNALAPGNITPAAEANVFNDAEAAEIVFAADWPITMVGLDVTHQALLNDAAFEAVCRGPKATSRHLAAALPFYRDFYRRVRGVDGVYLHDPAAVGYLIDPTMFQTEHWPIRVETQGLSRGKTWPWTGRPGSSPPSGWGGRRPAEVCVRLDAARLVGLLVERLS